MSVQFEPVTPVVESKFITNVIDDAGYEFQYPFAVNQVDASLPFENVCGVPYWFETYWAKIINELSVKSSVL